MTARFPLKIGFIPLVDAAPLIVAVDKGFAAGEGLDVTLMREVSWSNIRDKLAIGHYDAAHLLAPMAIASTLGLGHFRIPLIAACTLALNGNAITVSPPLFDALARACDGDVADPAASARALAKIVKERETRGLEPLTFGMTFPFSTHNYQLRYWMAEGGVDPDADLRLVVLPPPYMVESLAMGQVDGFCVGAPWNAVAADAGVGVILHPGCEIFRMAPEKVLALRGAGVEQDPDSVRALIRACLKGAQFAAAPENCEETAAILARPDRSGVEAEIIRRTLEGRLNVGGGAVRENKNYLIMGAGASGRPDQEQAAWLYAQMARWGQTRFSTDQLGAAMGVFRPALFDGAVGAPVAAPAPAAVGAFAGADFSSEDVISYLASFRIGAKT